MRTGVWEFLKNLSTHLKFYDIIHIVRSFLFFGKNKKSHHPTTYYQPTNQPTNKIKPTNPPHSTTIPHFHPKNHPNSSITPHFTPKNHKKITYTLHQTTKTLTNIKISQNNNQKPYKN